VAKIIKSYFYIHSSFAANSPWALDACFHSPAIQLGIQTGEYARLWLVSISNQI
jgi:hypothetical protein